MTYVLRAFSYGHGGLGVVILAVIGALALPRVASLHGLTADSIPRLWALVCLSILANFALTTGYLFSPGYMDHVEASVASSVHTLMAGQPLYPSLDSYTLSGLLYGPLLAELNSLGYVLFSGSFAAKLIGWLAGWTSIAVLFVVIRRGVPSPGNLAALAYALVFLVSFGSDVTVGRPEPLLLLFAAIAVAVAVTMQGVPGALVLGLLCGAAAELKAHAPLYLLPIVYFWASQQTTLWQKNRWIGLLACFAGAGILGLALPFQPHNVSLAGYVSFLQVAAKHGLIPDLFGRNCALVAGMWAPLLLLNGGFPDLVRARRNWSGFALILFTTECLVAVVASKAGAGVHHFLPFLAAHALLFKQMYLECSAAIPRRAVIAVSASILGMITPTAQTYADLWAFDRQWENQSLQRDELLELASRFPHGVIGASSNDSYALSNYRPWLSAAGTPQVDYAAFVDLQLSGATDQPLRDAFARCAIPYVYMPKPGIPFTLGSTYNGKPLFSDDLQREFAVHYDRVSSGVYFDVFGCRPG